MNISRRIVLSVTGLLSCFGLVGLFVASPVAYAAQPTVDLQTAAPFAILAGTVNITDAGNASVVNGNVGLSPASGSFIALLCSQVTGTIYSVDAAGPLPCRVTDGPLLVTAKNHLTAAYTDAAGRTPVATVATELGGTTKFAGVYDSGSTTFQITAGAGSLILDGQGDSSSVFIFEMGAAGTGLTAGPGSTISLINGAQACNVFWRVDTASIGTTAAFKGSILALNSISVANGANIVGRLLARNGSVTLINDTVTAANCAAATTSVSAPAPVVPKFPNAGLAPDTNSNNWGIVALGGLVTVSAAYALVHRKKVV